MGEILEHGEFWLPPEFFTGDGILSDEKNPLKPKSDFPANFVSYGSSFLSSSVFSSPVESVIGSTKTDSDEEDESVTGLTRCFAQFGIQANQVFWRPKNRIITKSPEACTWDLLYADVGGQASKMKMNGSDEGFFEGGPVTSPLGSIPTGSFYVNQFPFNQVDQGQLTNQNCGLILGRPSVNDLLDRQLQFQQHIISQQRSKFFVPNRLKENVRYLNSSLGLPYLARPYPLVEHQFNKMSSVAPLGIFGQKQACAGTGVFIPRPFTNHSSAPKISVSGHSTAQHPPRFYQAVNKNLTLTPPQALMAPCQDPLVVRSNTMPTQKIPRLQVDGYVKHEQCLPQEWSY